VAPGSGTPGRLLVGGHTPIGYYKDPEKTAATFVEVDGRRFVAAGDWAEVEPDGSVRLLGRGSGCINTGGEKVFPEEVEEALKLQPGIVDAGAIGVPDERLGQQVVAVVQVAPDVLFDPEAVIAGVKEHLAAYKAPKRVVAVTDLRRAPNGKLDYQYLSHIAGAAPA
jgi:fatty-acyl-CoA synthase